jgi:lipid-A-disaccharide synthase
MIGLLPGSRNNELKSLLDIMIEAATLIHRNNKKVVFIISKASSINRKIIEAGLKKIRNDSMFQIKEGPVKDIFFKSELVIAASGTVTLEAALCCVPTIIVYKISPVSYQMAKLFVKVKYVGLANLIVNAEVMPELLQNDVTPEKISKKALYMLDNLFYFQNQLQIVRKLLGKKGASKRAANIAVNMLATSKLPY